MTDSQNPECQLVTEKQAARMLQMSVYALRKWRSEGKHLPYVKIGNAVRYRLSTIADFISDNSIKVMDRYGQCIG